MSTATLTAEARRHVGLFSTDSFLGKVQPNIYTKETKAGLVTVVEKMPVFRSGTFRNSMGLQHTWEPIHMDQMVAHFDMLRNRRLFEDVPVRDGHPGFLISGLPGSGKVVGYHTGLVTETRVNPTDNKEYTYLLADYEILDVEARENIKKGLWRNRSSEVGTYVTNDEAEFWPVYMGVAYVDIPAVQGLNFSAFSMMYEGEAPPVSTTEAGQGGPSTEENTVTDPVTPAAPEAPATPAPPAAVQPTATPEQHTAPVAPAAPAASAAVPQMFKINGQEVSDYAAVQRHIETLELFQSDTVKTGRTAFVKGLAEKNQIMATQVDGLTAFALGLSDEQYEAWKTSMELSPAQSLLAPHGGTTPQGGEPDADAEELSIARDTVRRLEHSGMTKEQLEQTSAYQRLQQLEKKGK